MKAIHPLSQKGKPVFVALIATAALIAGCSEPTPVPPTATVTPLPEPAATAAPTATPQPTATPEPTAEPTAAPVERAIVPRDALAGTSWSVRTFGPLRLQTRLVRGTTLTLNFGNAGEVSGSAGCNTFTSSYVIDGDTIDIQPPARTRKSCRPLTMRQEYYYLEALEQAIRFTLDGDQLRLIYNRGRGAINLTLVEEYDEGNDANAPMGAYRTTIFVGPQLMDCDGAGQTCLAIRAEGEGRYLPYNGSIAGFDYVEGYHYELKVQAQPVANPEPGAPAIEYTLIEITRREAVEAKSPPSSEVGAGNPLEKTGWQLRAIETAGVETPALESVAVTLLFGEGNAVGGSSGCNTYISRYSVDGGAITFSPAVMTLKACPDPAVMEQEQTYLRALQGAETIAVFEGQLTLTFDGGNGVLRFVAIP